MIDAGIPGMERTFLGGLASAGVQPQEIRLLVITHGHLDHIGLASVIKKRSGAEVAIHWLERDWLESCRWPIPPGRTWLGKIVSWVAKRMPPISVAPTNADILFGDSGMSLEGFGIPGRVIHTPGHTRGSVSVLLESGVVFVGDLAMSACFMRLRPGLPIFAEDIALASQSLEKLLELGAKTIYPAHGRPFSADVFRRSGW